MTMTMMKQLEIAAKKKEREMEARAAAWNKAFEKEIKKEQVKENLKFRASCLKGFITGKI